MNLKLFVPLFFSALILLISCKQKSSNSPTSTAAQIEVVEQYQLADSTSLGKAGAYEVIRLRIESSIDVMNAIYSNLNDAKIWAKEEGKYAPYATEMIIFRPVDATKANGTVLFEWPNRGRTFALGLFNEARPPRAQRSDEPSAVMAEIPKTPREFGNKFLFNQGYTLVWAGWEANTYRRSGIFAELPIHETQKPVETREDFAVGFRAKKEATALPLLFEAATTNQNSVSLTKHMASHSTQLDTQTYTITSENEITLLNTDGTPQAFEQGAVYQLQYLAQEYALSGLGLAIMNDIALGIKNQGPLSALAPLTFQKNIPPNIVTLGASQPGRALRTFLRKLPDARGFDGHFIIAAGAGQSLIDMPFAQTSKTATAFHDSFLPEFLEEEPLELKSWDPKVMEVHTSSEYWQKIAFLTHAKEDGTPRKLSNNHRIYLLTGTQHSGGNGIRSTAGPCLFQRNLSKPTPVLRALITAMNDWTLNETLPPPTSIPSLNNTSLVIADALNFGNLLGINTPKPHSPPIFGKDGQSRKLTKVFVPNIDSIGNEQSGIKLPPISVPLSTRTGWNIDKHPLRKDCLCHQYGAYFPLAISIENQEKKDNRRTISDLYTNELAYAKKVEKEINGLISQGFVLKEEKVQLMEAALREYKAVFKLQK